MTLPTVFISYSHKDEQEKDALLTHLGVIQGTGLIDLWDDGRIAAGADWEQEIGAAMRQARVAILLISANYLASDFILKQEVPELLKHHDKETLTVFPVIAKACAWKRVDWLAKMHVRPKDGKPVWREGGRHADEDLALIAEEVAEVIDKALDDPIPQHEPALQSRQQAPAIGSEKPVVPKSDLSSQLPLTNPYANRAMIKDLDSFIGRTSELYDLYNLVAAMQSCSIVGPRRIGKSSLLYYLSQPAVYTHYLHNPDSYVIGFVDLQELASLEPDDFFYTAIEQLARASHGKLQINLERDGTKPGFRRFLMRVSDAGFRLILCCDEFEMLSRNENFKADFFTYLRGLCSNYNLALITSSRASLFDLCHQGDLQTSQFWNIFVERTLGLMTEHEAKALINEPFTQISGTITPDDESFVLNLAGRYPFFIQIACYHLFTAQLAGDIPDYSMIERRFLDEARHHYTYAWEHLDEEQQNALSTLVQKNVDPIGSNVFQRLVRDVVVTGTPDSPKLVSEGWRHFIESEVNITFIDHSSSAPVKSSPLSPIPYSEEVSEFTDFALKVEQIDATSCRVMVLDSPAGQDSVVCKLPFNLDSINEVMVDLGQQIARGPASSSPNQMNPTAVGKALFQAIFSGPISQLFFESTGRVHGSQQGLRVKIHVDPEGSPQLAALPWEFLYNDRRRNFLSLSRLTPIVRYLDVQAPTVRPQISLPLRVLIVIASPIGLPQLDLSREREFIRRAWGSRPDVSVEFLDPATPASLQARLWDWQPHVLHFMGHGQFDPITGAGALLFVDHKNEPKPIVGAQLGVLLSNVPSIQLAFLNACHSAELSRSNDLDPFSGVAAALVMAGLPAVVAMQFPISDQAALAFANGFYPRLAAGEPIELAVSFGREAIRLEIGDNDEWGTPVLFMRISDGRLFQIGGS